MLQKLQKSALIFFFLPSIFSGAYGQQSPADEKAFEKADEEIVRVETNLITVPVGVSDKNGRFVANLKKEDFSLTENGVEQEIAFFEDNDAPFTVVLALDLSESATGSFADIQKSAAAFLEQLNPRDKIILLAFNESVYFLSEATGDRDFLKKQIARLTSGGKTSVYDAVEGAGEKLGKIRGRKAIVLFSDGVDTASRATYESSLRLAREIDALAYTIGYETRDAVVRRLTSNVSGGEPVRIVTSKGEDLKTAYARATVYLKFLAEFSGGRYFLADSPANLTKTFGFIAEELRRQYSIGYYPKNSAARGGESRKIKVGVSVPNVVVKARKSYVFRNAGER